MMPEVRRAFREGRVLLKGGTTVSAVAEELVGLPLRISGRVSPEGTKGAAADDGAPHSIILEKGVARGEEHR